MSGGRDAVSVRLVVFDLGRVLVRICDDWRHACRCAGIAEPQRTPDAAALAALADLARQADRGEADAPTFATLAAPLMGLEPQQVQAISDAYILGPYDGAIDLLDALAARGVATACLSNTNDNHWRIMSDPAHRAGFPLDRLEHRFASHLVGARKPDGAIYAHVESATNTPADAILFFDDLQENIAAAETRGWRGVWIDPSLDDPVSQIRGALRAHGLIG